MQVVHILRSVVVLGRIRWWSQHRSEAVLRRATALVAEKVRQPFPSVHIAAIARGFVWITLITLAGGNTAQASDVSYGFLIGSVNPTTREISIFRDLLVDRFPDGGPIQHLYGQYDATKGFFLVRAGKSASGACVTETFKLTRLANNGLVLASEFSPVWDYIGFLNPTLWCSSPTCSGCIPHQTTGASPQPSCQCASGTGQCSVVDARDLPFYVAEEIVIH
jgi:hypothetical protein